MRKNETADLIHDLAECLQSAIAVHREGGGWDYGELEEGWIEVLDEYERWAERRRRVEHVFETWRVGG